MKVVSAIVIMMIIVTGVSIVYFIRPVIDITNEPVNVLDTPSDQHVVVYSVDINGNNITVGEIGLTWDLLFSGNTSEYDYYEFTLHELVRGSAADEGGVGWIEGGRTLLDLRTTSLMTRDWSESHGEGAVQVTTSTNTSWNGNIEWRFSILSGSGAFNPRQASNLIDFSLTIRALRGADVYLTLYAFTDWSIYGYSFDRVLIHGTETIVINQSSLS
jgi:hypothetical protein